MKKKLKFFYLGAIALLVLSLSLLAQNALAGGISGVAVTLKSGSNNISATSTAVPTTTVTFTPDSNINTNNGIQVEFAAGFDIHSVVGSDVAITQAHTTTDITKGAVSIDGQKLQIIVDTESDTPNGAVTITVTNSHITTPATPGTYTITISTWDLGLDNVWGDTHGETLNADTLKDSGFGAVVIGTNQVTIFGQVDPTLTLELSANSCGLGTIDSTTVKTCSYDTTVSTNASSGYTAYIKADSTLRNAINEIADVSGGTTVAGTEGYGVATSDTDSVDITAQESSVDCGTANGGADPVNAVALSTSDQSYATADAPVDVDVVTLCHSASITSTTPAGVYAQIVTITVVGNF